MKNYIFIICPFVTLVVCQILKFTVESITTKQMRWERLFNGAGGMPSSHTSFCMSLTALLAYTYGIQDPLFAIALVFTCIVAYDAIGLRWESGKQAEAINEIAQGLGHRHKFRFEHLKEELGHKPLEALAGACLGIIMSTVFFYCF